MRVERFIPSEMAVLLKMKGFDWACSSYYAHCSSVVTLYSGFVPEFSDSYMNHNEYSDRYSCPTQQMVLEWLRVEHNILLVPIHKITKKGIVHTAVYILGNEHGFIMEAKSKDNVSCENIMDAGIMYCLENIIK
jgi:hypothetical protein